VCSSDLDAREFDEVARECDGDGGHAAGLYDEQERPAVEERDRGVKCVAKVSVLSADFGAARGQLRVDERARERDRAAREPSAEYEEGRVNLSRDDRRVDEDA